MEEIASGTKKGYFFVIIIIILISLTGVVFGVWYIVNRYQPSKVALKCGQKDSRVTVTVNTANVREVTEDFPWWNDEYSYFKQITLVNENSVTSLPTDCWANMQFDHSFFVEQKKSRTDGLDLKLLYLDNNEYKDLSFKLSDPNTKSTQVIFKLEKELPSGKLDNSYFLYYGNAVAKENKSILQDGPEEEFIAQNTKIYRTRETHPKIFGSTNRQWLIRDTNINQEYSQLVYRAQIDSSILGENPPKYKVLGTNKSGVLEPNLQGDYEAKIETGDLAAGTYQIQSTITFEEKKYVSPKTGFYISFPLYVTMTIDWEGVDTDDAQLVELDDFSQTHYGLPITHFFNPRIYVTSEISEERADYLTQWVQVRKINGHEIGMHLHMHHDMVRAAGVTPRTSPKWTNYLNNGHDVPCSAYTYEEFMQILAWAKDEFYKQGLGVPKSFRAGGWFADLKVLRALDDSGFIIDSSGRTAYSWGQNQLRGHWNLSSTTHPYHPSMSNQNSSAPPTLSLWEFSNNGADSYFYEKEELIKRFKDNFNNAPLTQSQTLTYLSHPHAFSADRETLDPTFNYTDQYLASKDWGPVIYVTLEQAYEDYYKFR